MLYLSLGLSTAGIVLIAFISPLIEPPTSKISDVDASCLEKKITVQGQLTRTHRFKGGSMMLTLEDPPASLDVYVPYSAADSLNFSNGSTLKVTGVVQMYNGALELVLESAEQK